MAGNVSVHIATQTVITGLLAVAGALIRYLFLGLRDEQARTAEKIAKHGERIAAIEGKLSIAHLE